MKDRLAEAAGVVILWLMTQWEDIKDIIRSVVIWCFVFFIVTSFLFKPARVQGTSMNPTIKDGSLGFSSIVGKNVNGIKRFDIAVIRLEVKNELLIKRVIGLPGETVSFQNGELYIDGVLYQQDFLDQEYVAGEMKKYGRSSFTEDFTVTLGEDEYFCMGDNRIVSADSRVYGPFSSRDILSCGLFVFFPFDSFGIAE